MLSKMILSTCSAVTNKVAEYGKPTKVTHFVDDLLPKIKSAFLKALEFTIYTAILIVTGPPLYLFADKTFTDISTQAKTVAKKLLSAFATKKTVDPKTPVVPKTIGDRINDAIAYISTNTTKNRIATTGAVVGAIALYYYYSSSVPSNLPNESMAPDTCPLFPWILEDIAGREENFIHLVTSEIMQAASDAQSAFSLIESHRYIRSWLKILQGTYIKDQVEKLTGIESLSWMSPYDLGIIATLLQGWLLIYVLPGYFPCCDRKKEVVDSEDMRESLKNYISHNPKFDRKKIFQWVAQAFTEEPSLEKGVDSDEELPYAKEAEEFLKAYLESYPNSNRNEFLLKMNQLCIDEEHSNNPSLRVLDDEEIEKILPNSFQKIPGSPQKKLQAFMES